MPSLDPEGIDGIFPLRGGERVQARDAMPGIASIHLEEPEAPEASPKRAPEPEHQGPRLGASVRVDAPPPLVLPLPDLPFQLARRKGDLLRKASSLLAAGVLVLGLVLWLRSRDQAPVTEPVATVDPVAVVPVETVVPTPDPPPPPAEASPPTDPIAELIASASPADIPVPRALQQSLQGRQRIAVPGHFEGGSAQLQIDDSMAWDAVLHDLLQAVGDFHILVENQGESSDLGIRRANAIRDEVLNQGIDGDRVFVMTRIPSGESTRSPLEIVYTVVAE